LRPEDYDFNGEASEWGPKLLQALTTFCGDVTNALTGQLTRPQNIRGEEWEVVFDSGASPTIDSAPFPIYRTPSTAVSPRHVWVTLVEDITDSTAAAPASAVTPVWRLASDGKVVFRYFLGLDASRRYRIRGLME